MIVAEFALNLEVRALLHHRAIESYSPGPRLNCLRRFIYRALTRSFRLFAASSVDQLGQELELRKID